MHTFLQFDRIIGQFFARNFKEGQILSMPLMICIIAPFYFEMIYQHNLTRSILYYCVPFLNIPHLFSDIIQNRFSFLSLLSFACINVVVNVIITKIIIVIMSKGSSLNRRQRYEKVRTCYFDCFCSLFSCRLYDFLWYGQKTTRHFLCVGFIVVCGIN